MEQLKLDEGINNSGCKGIYFKGDVTTFHYTTKEGNLRICKKTQLRFLKRISCLGCPECGWFWEDLKETVKYVDLSEVEDNKTYSPQIVIDSTDEMGNPDDWHITFVEQN